MGSLQKQQCFQQLAATLAPILVLFFISFFFLNVRGFFKVPYIGEKSIEKVPALVVQ